MLIRLRRLLRALSLILLPLLFIHYVAKRWSPVPNPMSTSQSPHEVASSLLAEKGLHLQSLKVIQSLWAGYGQICLVTATRDLPQRTSAQSSRSVSAENSNVVTPQELQSYVLKLITPPPTRAQDEGHTRKILSYGVEQYFYSHLAPQLPPSVPVAKCLASINQHHCNGTSTTAMILSDLKQQYPIAGEKRNVLSTTQINAALDWLSGFHGFWWTRLHALDRASLVRPPLQEVQKDGDSAAEKTVWLNGGYTYLATRRTEYANLAEDEESEWRLPLTRPFAVQKPSISQMVATFLAPLSSGTSPISKFETLIHGDVKSENLFTSKSGEQVVFYDFQYTGVGLGVCDLAKLFTCSVPLSMLVADRSIPHELPMQEGEKQLLERYWKSLKTISGREYEWTTFVWHWEVALVDWLRFQASWGFWGNTEWLEARVRYILNDTAWRDALEANTTLG
ncbi:kinase-like domain-containing protein [Paraphoma chrysanthemicola]|nr:kinase-like domain-containing protein [Paraphoma chrysanthemicola]